MASEEAAREIEETARSVPGVSRVDSQLQVLPRRAGDENPPPREGDLVEPRRAPGEIPPPPPEPLLATPEPKRPRPWHGPSRPQRDQPDWTGKS